MLNFVNSYSLSTPKDQTKVLLNFMQNYPLPGPDDGDDIMHHELVSSIVIDADVALSLATDIMDSLDPERDFEDEDDCSAEE